MGYYAQMLEDAGTSSGVATAPLASMKEAIADGHGEAMVPVMLDHYRKRFGV